jgi:hypothetical protein
MLKIKIKYKRLKSEDVPELCSEARKELARKWCPCAIADCCNDVDNEDRLRRWTARERVCKFVKAIARVVARGIKSKTVLVHVLPVLPWMLMFVAFVP